MFSHVALGANDLEVSKQFYDATLGALGYSEGVMDPKGRYFYTSSKGIFILTKPIDGEDACHGNGSTIGFSSSTIALVDAWHQAGIDNGGMSCEEPPGVREGGPFKLYLAYLRDPSGNKICALHRMES
ncbi:VOC family protein [Pseudomonas sp. HK3]